MRHAVVSLLFSASLCATMACGGAGLHDFQIVGQGFLPNVGQTLHIAIVDADNGDIVATDEQVVASDGHWSFLFHDILAIHKNYDIDYYADLSGNGACDLAPDDHTWQTHADDVSGNVSLSVTHNTNWADVCSVFDE